MSLKERAIAAYREAQVQEKDWQDTEAKQFYEQAGRWLLKTFDVPHTSINLVPSTKNEATGRIGDTTIRIRIRYDCYVLEVKAPCPKCEKPAWHRGCTNLADLGKVLAGESTLLAELCECQPKWQPEPSAATRLTGAFVDMVSEIVDDR